MIIETAKQFHHDVKIESFSKVEIEKWHGLRRLDVAKEKRSTDKNAAEKYKKTFRDLVEQGKLTRCLVYNTVETILL